MTSTRQRDGCIPKMHLCAATVALALAFVLVLAVATPPSAQAQTYSEKVLYSFTGAPDGANPLFGRLAMAPKGVLYGTTVGGGSSTNCGSGGCGIVFKVSSKGKETVVYDFAGYSHSVFDGQSPFGTVIRDAKGTLYGTTMTGGLNAGGTVYKLDTTGKETKLYNFPAFPEDGSIPWGVVLVRGANGSLYGTTSSGGPNGWGTVFKLSFDGVETVLYSFGGPPEDGNGPRSGVLRDAKGNLYGTTCDGGTSGNCTGNCGIVFKVSSDGKETILHSFTGAPDGAYPYGVLVQDAKGNLYGTTSGGGTSTNCGSYGCGTVFEVSSEGKETVLYSFTGSPDGEWPVSGLLRDARGNLYGTAQYGGTLGFGNVFEVSSKGKETVLYNFAGTPDGADPMGDLIQDAKGTLYGTTEEGGTYNYGAVFKLTKK